MKIDRLLHSLRLRRQHRDGRSPGTGWRERAAATKALTKVATPAVHTIDEVAAFLNVAPTAIAKTLLVLAEEDEHGKQAVIALVLRGDHELNEIKAEAFWRG